MTAHVLQTLRLVLRPWRESDYEPFAAMNADPDVRKYFPSRLTMAESDAEADRIRAHFDQHGYGYFAVELPGIDDFIGIAGLAHARYPLPGLGTAWVDIGWRFARPYWSKGFAQESARAVVDFAFRDLKLPEVVAFTVPNNRRSRKVMDRLGMVHHAADDFLHPQIPADHAMAQHVLYRLDHDRWWAQTHQPG
jgi:RimJ/RimL family protein N-acetyltransferase